ncbi:lysine--tRNA ligase [Candidatus Woesearchaeota archaeon]|nr:lysine--tRNA ligase [Candidatus Woesearchaeota archaeon]
MPTEKELIAERVRKLEELRKLGINPYPYTFVKTHLANEVTGKYGSLEADAKTADTVVCAGRIVGLRRMGGASFGHILDETGRVQFYCKKDNLKEYDLLRLLDLGDFIGVSGKVFKTKTGEVTINVDNFTVLCKSIRPLPDKWHGLQDKELRYRRRYLDFVMNPDVTKVFHTRAKIVRTIREFLNNRGFMEVETPVLQPLYGGTNAKPFTTHYNEYHAKVYMRVAPELYLKRLIVGGFGKVYELGRNFRNEGADHSHNPEFTMLEFYEVGADYHVMMDTAEEIYKSIAKALFGSYSFSHKDRAIDVSGKWPRVPMTEAIKQHVKIDVDKLSMEELEKFVSQHRLEVRGTPSKGIFINAIFDKLVTPKLEGPLWIIDYPKEISPLAKPHRSKPGFVERFECYIGGMELGDGWSEINDPMDQRERFEREQQALRDGHTEAHPLDEDFIEALEHGMPTLGGIGIGIDRLTMFFTSQDTIRDVLLFPYMKPLTDAHTPPHLRVVPEEHQP